MRALLIRGTGVGSRLIQLRLQEHWSHGVGLVPDLPGQILDSTLRHGGVKQRALHDALRNVSDVLELHVPLPDEERGLAFAKSCVGAVRYDIEALWGFTVGSRHWHNARSMYCFEYLGAWMRKGGIRELDGERMVTGKNLVAVALKYGSVRRLSLTVGASELLQTG